MVSIINILVENLPICVSIGDATKNLHLIYVNKCFSDTGYSKLYSYGKSCKFLQGPKTEQVSIKRMIDGFKEQKTIKVLITNYTRDQTEFKNYLIMKPLFQPNINEKIIILYSFSS